MKNKIIILFALAVSLFACEENTPEYPVSETPVVEAFINPENDSLIIRISKMISYMSDEQDTVQQANTDCMVQMIYNGDYIDLIHDYENPGYYFVLQENFILIPGDSIAFSGTYKDMSFSAQTLIPSDPMDLTISKDKLYYDSSNPRSMMQSEDITISWTNPELDFYYVSIENIEENPAPLNEMMEEAPKFSFAIPSKSDQFQINMRNIRYFGEHRAIVFHVNPEFADIFDHTELTSNTIVEPPGNIENGLGIFTALSADTVFFTVQGI